MRRVIGANICSTTDFIQLQDGGAALVVDGEIVTAISEERLSRKKYAGGFSKSIRYCIDANRLNLNDIDKFVFSLCCDVTPSKMHVRHILREDGLEDIQDDKIEIIPSHHLSHAYSAFIPSEFDESLILVADNEGSIIDKRHDEYFRNALERTSVYLGRGNRIELLGRFHDNLEKHGLCSLYSAITQAIGYHSYQDAGKTMALAPYGSGKIQPGDFFDMNSLECLVPIHSTAHDDIQYITSLLERQTGRATEIGNTHIPTNDQKELAWAAQNALELVSRQIVQKFSRETGIKNLCIAGGVGLNCVNNTSLFEDTDIEQVFVQPAAGDSGQCLGNALYGYYSANPEAKRIRQKHSYLGRAYSKKEREGAVANVTHLKKLEVENVHSEMASYLKEGAVIGFFSGGSEFGPRALGHRSLIASPCSEIAKRKLDAIKNREYYRPYAPSVLGEHVQEYFDIEGQDPRFMLFACKVKPEMKSVIPYVVHVDGTSRIQAVYNDEIIRPYYETIKAFYGLTGIPLVLNTSFNTSGTPIVETPEDAIRCFFDVCIDFLYLDGELYAKR